jgi:hypothetical protein
LGRRQRRQRSGPKSTHTRPKKQQSGMAAFPPKKIDAKKYDPYKINSMEILGLSSAAVEEPPHKRFAKTNSQW